MDFKIQANETLVKVRTFITKLSEKMAESLSLTIKVAYGSKLIRLPIFEIKKFNGKPYQLAYIFRCL